MRRRKPRPVEEIQTDPDFAFYVGRLVGASEMASWWLQMQQQGESQEMGKRLGMVVGWFLTDEPDKEQTLVLPPPKA